ncbi:MAG: Holliday junction branch migration protein RuvA [Candidatus Saccharibacteria bacterium]
MIAFLRGVIVEALSESVVIDVGGIGYEVFVHARALRSLPDKGRETLLFTRLQVGDNEFKLYGFLGREELELFKTLTAMSGLGPRIAMAILGTFNPEQFYRLVASQDIKQLTTVPGVGKKSAERIMFELKDKIPQVASIAHTSQGVEIDALLEALSALGFGRSEVYSDVINLVERGEMGTLEESIKKILKARGTRNPVLR